VLSAFNDNAAMIRSAASQDIVAFLGILEPRNWPECLHHLFMALDSDDLEKQEVSFFPPFSTPIKNLWCDVFDPPFVPCYDDCRSSSYPYFFHTV
jgi:hypothetical protein